ncbi:ABC transporter substrate-binding protein [Vallitalea longa]|uniref:ABC transporter substrate-binding protein n=1 Tax=Vallitalea longa TaxID=2936439 RepID=A0A9W5YEM6_9FIRM|nr:ABC transporter substrate-binding protein [Vallitalea longa]GKX30923.1 ABC transporter substrate-binding protein [Vallitalea longa]
MKKLSKILLSLMLIMTLVFSLGACNNKTDTSIDKQENEAITYPMDVEDKYGNNITIEKEPETVISLSPEFTETIFALEAGDKLVGRTDYCDYPSEVEDIESLGELTQPDIERIVEIGPDIVLVSAHVSDETITQLQQQGITVLALALTGGFDDTYKYIATLGKVLNVKDKSDKIIDDMKDKVSELTKAVEGKEKPTAYFVVGYGEHNSTATGETFLGKLIESAGAENIAKDATGWSYSIEQLVDQDPEIVICSNKFDSKSKIEQLEGYKDLTAVKEGRLYETDENVFFRQGPRLVVGLEELVKIFHPEVLE